MFLKFEYFPIFLYRAPFLKEINIHVVEKLQPPSNLLIKEYFCLNQKNRIYQYSCFLAASVYFSFGDKIPSTLYVLQLNKTNL